MTNSVPRWRRWFNPSAQAAALWLLSLAWFQRPLWEMVSRAIHDERSVHTVLVPLISAFLVFLDRRRIFRSVRPCPVVAVGLLAVAFTLHYCLKPPLTSASNPDHLSWSIALVVLVWIAAFVLCCGMDSLRAGAFPLFFLALMIPLPTVVQAQIVAVLQRGSADVCRALFQLTGMPFLQHGLFFSLPGVDIEIAEQCSGIQSGLSLFIVGVLASHLLLRRGWQKAAFLLCIFPIAVFKNAARIVAISWLGVYVTPTFFHGQLHREGGILFSALALGLMGLVLWIFRRYVAGLRGILRHAVS